MTLNGRCSIYCRKHALSEPITKIWMKVGPNYRQQKCRPVTLFSGDIRFMRIFAAVPCGEAVKRQWGCRQWQLLYSDTQSIVGFSVISKCVTLNDLELLFRVKLFSCRFVWLPTLRFSKIIAWKLIKIDILSAEQIFVRDSSLWQYKV